MVENNGADMTIANGLVITGPLTTGAKLVVGYAVGVEFAESSEDYSFAFESRFADSGAVISYNSATGKYSVVIPDYTDFNTLTSEQAAMLDLNGDGRINVIDLTLLKQIVWQGA